MLHAVQYFLLLAVGWVSREQQAVIGYLQAENETLREQLGNRKPRYTARQRQGLRRLERHSVARCSPRTPRS